MKMYQNTRGHNLEKDDINCHNRENLRFHADISTLGTRYLNEKHWSSGGNVFGIWKGESKKGPLLPPFTVIILCKIEVLMAMTMKYAVFWDVALCSYCVNRLFGGTYRLHLQGRKIRERGTSVSSWRRCIPPKRRFTQELHGATSQKT
jgi:hypothetical protein